jgi:hypothetical protein
MQQKINFQTNALAISDAKKVLSKAQKEFNRLTEKIATLRNEIHGFEESTTKMSQRVTTELKPLLKEFSMHQAALVRLFDKAHDSGEYKAKDKKKLSHLISEMAFGLISEHGMEDLKPIFDKYNKESFDETTSEANEVSLEMAKNMAAMMYGIDIDKDADLDTAEKFHEYLHQKIAEKEEQDEILRAQREEARANAPKTEKKRLKEEKYKAKKDKEAAEEKKLSQSVREVYMDLVKTFHPDLEQNEEEKARKTTIMQRVVAAYQDNDLTTLLQLQMEFERIDKEHIGNIAENRLLQFNKILSRQAKDLNETLWDVKERIANACGRDTHELKTPAVIDFFLNTSIKEAKKDLKSIKTEVQELENPLQMKTFVKYYQIPRSSGFGDMFENYF